MSPNTHPAAAPAIDALNDLDAWTPANADELAQAIAALYQYGEDNVITALYGVLDRLAESLDRVPDLTAQQRELAATWLGRAAGRLGFISEALDQARLATGKWT
jgi:hypothetical protein